MIIDHALFSLRVTNWHTQFHEDMVQLPKGCSCCISSLQKPALNTGPAETAFLGIHYS
jgi:hypothetical protein